MDRAIHVTIVDTIEKEVPSVSGIRNSDGVTTGAVENSEVGTTVISSRKETGTLTAAVKVKNKP